MKMMAFHQRQADLCT